MSYTTKYDWPIRHLLDDAEDYIANDAQAAIDKINAILEKYPESPRAKYDLARAIQFRFNERERKETITAEEKLEHTLDLIQKFVDIMTMYKPLEETADEESEEEEDAVDYALPPGILNSAYHQAIQECDSMNLTKLYTEITEKLFEINPNYANQVPML
jgi:hypothetical protein